VQQFGPLLDFFVAIVHGTPPEKALRTSGPSPQ
jgi:hypothetical protein